MSDAANLFVDSGHIHKNDLNIYKQSGSLARFPEDMGKVWAVEEICRECLVILQSAFFLCQPQPVEEAWSLPRIYGITSRF